MARFRWTANDLARQVDDGWLTARRHPTEPLTIYNYTARCQYDRHWTPITRACRGVILHDDGRVIARPFPKFFNLEEMPRSWVPKPPFSVTTKHDGSLGILYRASDGLRIATRGSFASPQAEFATALFVELGHDGLPWDTDRFTYLFEIISPTHRIVVDYGSAERLVLLAVIETATGKDAPMPDWYPDRVREHPWTGSIEHLGALSVPNAEGYVVRCGDGTRVKIKFEEYKRLHRLIFGLNARVIWEYLSQDRPLDDLIEGVPDELYGWVKGVETRLDAKFTDIKRRCRIMADTLAPFSRREQAVRIVDAPERAVIFKMLDGQPYDQVIWRLVKPSGTEVFRAVGEDEE